MRHGNEVDFPRFLHKSVQHRSLTLHFEPFRFWLRIRGDIRIRKSTPRYHRYGESPTLRIGDRGSRRLPVALSRGVDDSLHHRYWESVIDFFKENSPYRWYGESSTPRLNDTSWRVADSPYGWVGESLTLCMVQSGSRWLFVLLSRGVVKSAYCWVGESKTPRIGESGSHYLIKISTRKNNISSDLYVCLLLQASLVSAVVGVSAVLGVLLLASPFLICQCCWLLLVLLRVFLQ